MLPGAISSGIKYNIIFEQLDAIIAAGATLDEVEKWYNGGYPVEFVSRIIAWRKMTHYIKNHTQAALHQASKGKNK